MAQKVQVLLVDDLDGGEADETVTFALDGKTYEIDLTTANADKLRGLLEPYTKSGRRTGGRSAAGRGKGRSVAASGGNKDTAEIRAWAKANGFEVNDRGRVPATVREAYEKANG
ncbi:histone-like nucleoid-structuring protein Lsr2 [Streptomyces purpureus]|uniref:Lsr2 family protein n=1 Tax=Streptomyces purpureus TaxID=1951 RepID=A0A918LR19_9ACTN|nr:Lsr2 family protein [Streptomyces purpureus]GGT37777.1 Lsr2 family protein [Streptomyces purpureus]